MREAPRAVGSYTTGLDTIWFFERGGTIESAVSYYATSAATLQRVFRKHSPAHQKSATDVWDRRR